MDVRLSGAPRGLSQHGAHGAAGVRVPARHAATYAAAPAALPATLDAPAIDPRGRPQGLFPCGVLAAPPRERGPGAPVRDRAHAAPVGSGCGPATPATIGGRQAGTVPPVPRPPAAAMRAVPAGAAGSGALLRAGARGPPSGSGGGSGILTGPAGVAGAPGAANQAPLRGAGTGGSRPPPAAGLPLAQPTGTPRPGTEYSALGGEYSPPLPPRGIQRASQQGGGGGGGSNRIGQRTSVARDSWRAATPPPPPSLGVGALGGSTALGGGARGGVSHERRFFRNITRTDGVPGATGLPPTPPPPPRCAGEGREGGAGSMMGEAPASAPPPITLPTFAPSRGRGGAAGARRERGGTGTGWCSATSAGQ